MRIFLNANILFSGARMDLPGLPEKDRIVLAAAAALGCGALVTGDRTHFGRFYGRTVAGIRIHSPRSLYDEMIFAVD